MKTKKIISNIKLRGALILLMLLTPLFMFTQNDLEIKGFKKSFTFNNTYDIDMQTNANSETISGFKAVAKFDIDVNGKGTIEFITFKSTLVNVKLKPSPFSDSL